jgi:hypothetical protein
MRCGEDTLEDCVTAHLAPEYGLRRSGTPSEMQWGQGRCPACGGGHCLSVRIASGRIEVHCNRKPSCPGDTLREKIAERFPQCISMRRPKPRPDIRAEAEAIVLDSTLSAATLRLRILMLTSELTAKEAASKLGYSRSTYYAAVGNLGRGKR